MLSHSTAGSMETETEVDCISVMSSSLVVPVIFQALSRCMWLHVAACGLARRRAQTLTISLTVESSRER